MSHELETTAAASAGSFLKWRRRVDHDLPEGAPCANCATPLMGPWCHACGQLGEDFHRSSWKLFMETVEGLFHLDGRLWRTLPGLMIRPGQLTRSYLEGHRAPQIPPLRLFLVVLLLVFTTGSLGRHSFVNIQSKGDRASSSAPASEGLGALTPAQRDRIKGETDKVQVKFASDKVDKPASEWLQIRLKKVVDEPERFGLVLESWGERFAFLLLPLSAALLSIAFLFRRGVYLFDHVIFSLHSLSFLGLLTSAFFILPQSVGVWLFLAAPVHLFFHMRQVYRTSIMGAILRMGWLLLGTLVGVVFIILGLLAVGLSEMG